MFRFYLRFIAKRCFRMYIFIWSNWITKLAAIYTTTTTTSQSHQHFTIYIFIFIVRVLLSFIIVIYLIWFCFVTFCSIPNKMWFSWYLNSLNWRYVLFWNCCAVHQQLIIVATKIKKKQKKKKRKLKYLSFALCILYMDFWCNFKEVIQSCWCLRA